MCVSSSGSSAMLTSVLLFVSVGQVTITTADMKQYFIREPDNQTAIEGEQVRKGCKFVGGKYLYLK